MFLQKKTKIKKINYIDEKFRISRRKKFEKLFFWTLIIFVSFSFFARNNFKSVKHPDPELFNEPVKSKLSNSNLIKFSLDGFKFELTPLYEYEMAVLVVNRFDYTWFSLTRANSAIPMDLCVTWGDNVKNGGYRHPSVNFYQDHRFCFGNWGPGANFSWTEVSNNHLIIKDPALRKKALSINEGDQIRLKGKLVNLRAENEDGKPGKYESQIRNWNSSVRLGDSGAGACEVIFVEELEIIRKGNVLFSYGFKISLGLLLFFIAWKGIEFFYKSPIK